MRQRGRVRPASATRFWLAVAIIMVVGGPGGLPARVGASQGATDDRTTTGPVCAPARPGEAACFALRRIDAPARRDLQPNGADRADGADGAAPDGYGPAELRAAYGLPSNGGAGATIAIVAAYDNPNAEADLAAYRARYGLPACTTANGCFRKIDQRGGTKYPDPDRGWAGEISLDLDMASAVAPLAHLLLVEADSPRFASLGAAVDQAVASGARYVSNSYGAGEDPALVAANSAHYDHPGVAVVAATGDSDYGVAFPASSRRVTAVGGTSLIKDDTGRGWSESVWHDDRGGAGSGCSAVEAKPAFQTDRWCANRMVADVAAVADPATGVAVYDSFGPARGWGVYGGTSAAAPIITGIYATAGTPAEGTYPNSYPYTRPRALHDITKGANGGCTPAYLCTAGPGYDGPTGLGTPNGVTAFHAGPFGTLTGTVTDTAGRPVPAVTVTAGVADTITDTDGRYTLHLPPGSVDVTAALLGYQTATATAGITDRGTTTADLTLTARPHAQVSGVVTDGSGHGWPMYAKVTVAGLPGAAYTDPLTGRYRLDLPTDQAHQLRVTPLTEGYRPAQATVAVASTAVTVDPIALPVDAVTCTVPGYHDHLTGATEPFDGPAPPTGWSVHDATGNGGWRFDDPAQRTNETGGSGGFAVVDSNNSDPERPMDAALTAPAIDFGAAPTPLISFDTYYHSSNYRIGHADVDLSLDGGATWSTIWRRGAYQEVYGDHIELFVPQAAGKAGVRARFRYVADHNEDGWQIDNVFIGNHGCEPTPGGLIAGQVTDANTGTGIAGAQVSTSDGDVTTATATATTTATTTATPDDPGLGDGFYTLYTPDAGIRRLTVTSHHRVTATTSVTTTADRTTPADLALASGRIAATGPTSIDQTVVWGATGAATITLTNTGTAPATVTTSEQTRGAEPLAHTGPAAGTAASTAAGTAASTAAGTAAWAAIADLPVEVRDNVAAVHNGRLYSAFGMVNWEPTAALYVYDPATGVWSRLASAAGPRAAPVAAFLDGRLYAVGGLRPDDSVDPTMEVYDPASDTWSFAAPVPLPRAYAGSAVVDGRLYLVGGCSAVTCRTQEVQVYDPASNTWTVAAGYPQPVSSLACGAIRGRLYCAGGMVEIPGGGEIVYSAASYVYDPASDTWSPRAAMPATVAEAASGTANGLLLVAGGRIGTFDDLGNRAFAYDPVADTWSRLPDLGGMAVGGAGACGFYRVGGSGAAAEVLPGYGDCGGTSDWLSTGITGTTLQPGASATLTVTLDAAATGVAQPGSYTARVVVDTDTPYPAMAVPVIMTVRPPPTWGRITGTVTAAADGTPIHGATVQIEAAAASHTLTTDDRGEYVLWLAADGSPLQVIVAKARYQPQARTVTVTPAATTTASFALKKQR